MYQLADRPGQFANWRLDGIYDELPLLSSILLGQVIVSDNYQYPLPKKKHEQKTKNRCIIAWKPHF